MKKLYPCMVCEKRYAEIEQAEVCERKHDAKGEEMSIMGRVTLECDTKGCHGSEVIEAEDFNGADIKRSITVSASFAGWVMDDDGEFHCPQCCQDAQDAAEKNAEIRACGGYEAWRSL